MQCEDFHKLIDSHLQGELAGTLRLEFDAHRVRCAECEHAVTLLEVVTSVIASPAPTPQQVSPDFTDKVMAQIAAPAVIRHPAASRRHAGLRAVLVAGALVQAAAVWMLMVVPQHPGRIPSSTPPDQIDEKASPDAITRFIGEASLRLAKATGNVAKAQELEQFVMSLNVSENEMVYPAGLLQAILPVQPKSTQPAPAQAGNQFSF